MKTNYSILLLLAVIYCGSCTFNSIEPTADDVCCKTHVVPVEQALGELNCVLNDMRGFTTKSLPARDLEVKVLSSKAMTRVANSLQIDTLLYVVDFGNDEGYAILAADDRIQETVLAVVDSGDSSSFCASASANGYEFYPEDGMGDFNLYNSQYDEYYLAEEPSVLINNMMASHLLCNFDPRRDEEGGASECFYWITSQTINPMLKTKWHQDKPFNDMCPVKRNGNRAPAGCVPVAVGQIMAYHEVPTILTIFGHRVNWTEMKTVWDNDISTVDSEIGKNDVAYLLYGIGLMCNTTYASEWSFALPEEAKTFMSGIGFRNVVKSTGYNNASIMQMLEDGKPVFVSAISGAVHGHAWVVDGAIEQQLSNGAATRTFVHCNWGWGGSCNGYYASGVFDLTNGAVKIDATYGDSSNAKDRDYDWHFRVITYDVQ